MKDRFMAMRPLLLKVVGYPLFFMFWFTLFIYWTFPYDRLREAIVAAVEAPRRGPGGTMVPSNTQVTIGEISPTILPGISAKNVNLTFLPTRVGDRPVTMQMQSVTAHVGLFGLLASNLNADVSIQGMGGTVDAHIEQALSGAHPGVRELKVDLVHIRVADLAPLTAVVGLPLTGSMDGAIDLHVPDARTEQANGTIHFAFDDLRIGDGHAQFQIPRFGGVTIEQIRAGRLETNINVRDGVATIDRLGSQSPEFHMSSNGRISLRPAFGQSDVNVSLQFQLTDVYRHKSEQAGRIMSVLDIVPDIQRARRPDGMLAFHCTGTFDHMLCPPDPRGGAAARPLPAAARRAF